MGSSANSVTPGALSNSFLLKVMLERLCYWDSSCIIIITLVAHVYICSPTKAYTNHKTSNKYSIMDSLWDLIQTYLLSSKFHSSFKRKKHGFDTTHLNWITTTMYYTEDTSGNYIYAIHCKASCKSFYFIQYFSFTLHYLNLLYH